MIASTMCLLIRRVCRHHRILRSIFLDARDGRNGRVILFTRSSKSRFFGVHVVYFLNLSGGVFVRFKGRSCFVVAYLTA